MCCCSGYAPAWAECERRAEGKRLRVGIRYARSRRIWGC